MRDPATRVDPEVEVAVEETRRFLEPYVRSPCWRADVDRQMITLYDAQLLIEVSLLPKWVKDSVREPLFNAMLKRKAKPTRHYRNYNIHLAACPLVKRGYLLTRNEVTRDKQSAAAIIQKALARLGVRMSEKQINAIVLNPPPTKLP
jgi:hypothetical protein